jgi:hypothetical protein
MFVVLQHDDNHFIAKPTTQKIDDEMTNDLKNIALLPGKLINTIFNEDKIDDVSRYFKNLITLSRSEFKPNQIAPRSDGVIKYFIFDKSLKSHSMGYMPYEYFSAKIDTHNFVLKSTNTKNGNNIMNDYLIGLHLNKLSNMTNVFNKYHGMFKCTNNQIDTWCSKKDTHICFKSNEMRYFIISEGFSFSEYEYPQIFPDINLHEYLIKNKTVKHDKLCIILVQILCGIHFAQEMFNFEHKNLTSVNIIIHNIKPTKINYKIGNSRLTFTTSIIPIIHNFHASKIYKNMLPKLSGDIASNTVTDPSNEFESAYWNNDKTKLVKLLSELPAIIGPHGSLELYVDMVYGQNTEIIDIINLVVIANDFGQTVNEKPPIVLPYDQTSDMRKLLQDLAKFFYVLTDDKTKELLRNLNENKTTYRSVIDCINDIITFNVTN